MRRAGDIEGALEVELGEDAIDASLREHLFRPAARCTTIQKTSDGANGAA